MIGIPEILMVILLLYFFYALAAEILEIAEASIVFDVVNNCCQILLLWGSNCLIHDV